MAHVPYTVSEVPPFTIHVKSDVDDVNRYQGRTDVEILFEAITDGKAHTYTITVSKDGCQTAKTITMLCGAAVGTLPRFVAASPVNPTCNGIEPTNGSVSITNIENADRYKLILNGAYVNTQDCTVPDGYWNGTTATVLLPHPPAGQSYTYIIRAYNGARCGDWYDQSVTVTSPSCTAQSTQPSFTMYVDQPSCNGNVPGPAYLRLRSGINAAKYYVSAAGTYNGTVDCMNTAGTGTFSNGQADYVINAPASGASQLYTVRVYNGINCNEWADQTVTVTSPVCQGVPSTQPAFTLSVDQPVCAGNAAGPAYLRIRNGINATRYVIILGNITSAIDCNNNPRVITNGQADFTINSIPLPGQSQLYSVRAYNAGSCGEWADQQVTVTTPVCQGTAPVADTPTFIASASQTGNCSGTTPDSININLFDVVNGDRYNYSFGSTYTGTNNCGAPAGVINSGGAAFSVPLTAAMSGTSQSLTFRVYNGANCGVYQDQTLTFTVTTCTATIPTTSEAATTVGAANIDILYNNVDVNTAGDYGSAYNYAFTLKLTEPGMVETGQIAAISSGDNRFIGVKSIPGAIAIGALGSTPSNTSTVSFYRFAISIARLRALYPGKASVSFAVYGIRSGGNPDVASANRISSVTVNRSQTTGIVAKAPAQNIDFTTTGPALQSTNTTNNIGNKSVAKTNTLLFNVTVNTAAGTIALSSPTVA